MVTQRGEVVLEGRGLTKRYGSVVALSGASIRIRAGELLALVGDNGAGKSSMVSVLSGAKSPSEGEILHAGLPVRFASPRDARALGIETVWQGLALVPTLDIAGNMFLAREPVRGWLPKPISVLDRRRMAKGAAERLEALGVRLNARLGDPVSNLSGGQRQIVAVARAAAWATDVLFLDEPTAALGVEQTVAVLELARRVADSGLAVVMITHTIPHVMDYCDRVVVMRHGTEVADLKVAETTTDRIVSLIVGAER